MNGVLLLLSVQALPISEPPSVGVQSQNQSGGVTAGWINNYNQYVTDSDTVPSLSTELAKSPTKNGKYSLTLTVRNPSKYNIDLVSIRYSVGSEILGMEGSFGRKAIGHDSKIDIIIAESISLERPTVIVHAAYVAADRATTSRSFEEKFVVPASSIGLEVNPVEHIDGPIEQFGQRGIFESSDELLRAKGEYAFTLVDDLSVEASGGFQTTNKYLLFNSMSQVVMFATYYDRKAICLAVPLFPRKSGLRKVRVYWDDRRKKGGLNVDGIEVNNSNSAEVRFDGPIKCSNKVKSDYGTLKRIWSE